MHDNDTPPRGNPPFGGPVCPDDQGPTRPHCWDARCPWLVCERNNHEIRVRDAHVSGQRGEYRPDPRGAYQARHDGEGDPRTPAFWDGVYAAEKS